MTRFGTIARRHVLRHFGTQFVLGFIGVSSVVLLVTGAYGWRQALQYTRDLSQRVHAVRLDLTRAYLVLARVAAGDSTFSVADATAYAENAHRDLRALLGDGPTTDGSVATIVHDDTLRAMLGRLERSAASFDSLSRENGNTARIDERVAFGTFERAASAVDVKLQADLNATETTQMRDIGLIVGVWVLFLIGVGVVGRALTRSRRRAERELRRNEARYRLLSSLAPVGIFRADGSGTVLDVNERWGRLAGRSGDVLSGAPWFEIVHADERERVERVWHDARRRKTEFRIECRLASEGERERWVLVRAAFGDGPNVVGTLIDVSERKQVESQLRQAQKLEAVGQLTGGIAHDFNNLLTVVTSNAEILEESITTDQPDVHDMLRDIRGAAESGSELVRGLLGFSRRSDLKFADVRLADVVRGAVKLVRRVLPSDVTLQYDEPDDSIRVQADAVAVQQMVLNLATNARDAMPDGGRLVLRAEWRDVPESALATHPWAAPGRYGVLALRDTGTGMSEAVRARIFEPFFTTKPVGRGTGLGLAMVYGLMRQHRGFIFVESSEGAGTEFQLGFPESAGAPRASDPTVGRVPAPRRAGQAHVLVVDDQEDLRRALRRTLEHLGYGVTVATTGTQALELLREKHRFDLVIADIVMPGMSGVDLYDQLQSDARPPFIFTSGHTARDAQERARVPDDAPFLRKPWTIAELNQQLREVLDQV